MQAGLFEEKYVGRKDFSIQVVVRSGDLPATSAEQLVLSNVAS